MPRTSLGSLYYDLVADTKKFSSGLSRAEHMAKKRSRAIKNVFRGLGVAIGAALGGSALAAARSAARELGNISDQADKLGVTTDAMQELRFAAEQAGVKVQSFDIGFQRFTRRAADAAQGNKVLAKTFKDFNIELTDQNGRLKSNEELFMNFADAIAASDDQGKRILKTFQLFDTEGVDLVRLLQQGSDAIVKFREEAHRMGAVVDEAVIRKADAADKRLAAMSRVISLQVNTSLATLAPILVNVAEGFARATTAVTGFLEKVGAIDVSPLKDYQNRLQEAREKLAAEERRSQTLIGKGIAKVAPDFFDKRIAELQNDIRVFEGAIEHMQRIGDIKPLRGLPPPPPLPTSTSKKTMEKMIGPMQEWTKLIEEGAELTRSLRSDTDILFDSLDRYDLLLDRNIITQDTWAKAVARAHKNAEGMNKETEEASKLAQDLGYTFESAFEAAILEGEKLRDVIKGLAKDIARTVVRRTITEPLGTAVGDWVKGIFTAANGTNFAPGGLSLVGERGPELVDLPRGSKVIPNHELTSVSAGGTFNANFTIVANDARGFGQLLAQQEGQIVGMMQKAWNKQGLRGAQR